MMICPETYYEMNLKGKDEKQLLSAIRGLKKHKFYIVPGINIAFLRVASRLVPRSLLVKLVYFQQKKKRIV